MNADILVRPIRHGEEEVVCEIVRRSFDAFVGCEYSSEGVTEFYRYANPIAMASRLSADHFVLVAEYRSHVVGMIEFRKNEHLSLLFVEPSYLRLGIARSLFENALIVIREASPSTNKITVNSSRYAVPVYESLGFMISGAENTIKGITYVPLSREVSSGGT
jgi:GNAT superfamily N-acetyltransferase